MLKDLKVIKREEIKNILFEKDNVIYCGKSKDFITKEYVIIKGEIFLYLERIFKNNLIGKEIIYFSFASKTNFNLYSTIVYFRNGEFNKIKQQFKFGNEIIILKDRVKGNVDQFVYRSQIKKSLKCKKCVQYNMLKFTLWEKMVYSYFKNTLSEFTFSYFYKNYEEELKNYEEKNKKCDCVNKKYEINNILNRFIERGYKNNKLIYKCSRFYGYLDNGWCKIFDRGKVIAFLSDHKINYFDLKSGLFVKRNKEGKLISITKNGECLLKIKRYGGKIIEYWDYMGNIYYKKVFKNPCQLDGEEIFKLNCLDLNLKSLIDNDI
jgi:hypothetical protein